MRRYGLRDDQRERIGDLLPGQEGHRGVTAADNRLFVEAVIWKFRSGAPPVQARGRLWRDLRRAFRGLEKRPPPLRPLGQERRLAACFQAFGG